LAILAATTLLPAIADAQPIRPLAQEYVAVFESPDPQRVFAYSPGIARLESGRLVATLDLGGPGMETSQGTVGVRYGKKIQGKVYTSEDGGQT